MEAGRDYRQVLANPDALRCQMQGHTASADPEIRSAVREGYMEVFDLVSKLTGADRGTVTRFMAYGNLLNLGAVLDLPPDYLQID